MDRMWFKHTVNLFSLTSLVAYFHTNEIGIFGDGYILGYGLAKEAANLIQESIFEISDIGRLSNL